MWPFTKRRQSNKGSPIITDEEIIRVFSRILPRESIEKALKSPPISIAPREGNVPYILVQLRDFELPISMNRLELAIGILRSHGATVKLVSTLVLGSFLLDDEANTDPQQAEAVRVLSKELGSNFRAVVGCRYGAYVDVLCSGEFYHGVVLSEFENIVRTLMESEYGVVTAL